jgi:hypothetical protein
MDKIKAQAGKVGQLVFAGETSSTYGKALTLTWDILRETALLVWLVVCLVFVGGEWFWHTAIGLGAKARAWYEGLSQTDDSGEAKSFTDMGQSLLTAGENGAAFLLYQAKKQLGLDAEPPTPKNACQETCPGCSGTCCPGSNPSRCSPGSSPRRYQHPRHSGSRRRGRGRRGRLARDRVLIHINELQSSNPRCLN